ncbi:MAG: triphosphoribosyl-dephospho-CoA synthase [Planctomycetota bacterium]
MSEPFTLSAATLATLACSLEVSAPKPGNVHRSADFEDSIFQDFITSAIILGQTIENQSDSDLGTTILSAVLANQKWVGTNTNLGMILLIVPLSKIATKSSSELNSVQIREYLQSLGPHHGAKVFEAIRIANPAGLGKTNELDVNSTRNQVDLIEAMNLAADKDMVAQQYVTGFKEVIDHVVPALIQGQQIFHELPHAIVFAHLVTMSKFPDSLIQRKCGIETARQSQWMAQKAIDGILNEDIVANESMVEYWNAVTDLDFWLRSDGHKRNPGTSADLIAAGLFIAIWNQILTPPFR